MIAARHHVKEVLVFAHDIESVELRVAPDFAVGSFRHPDFMDMHSLNAALRKEVFERWRELLIDQKSHGVTRTAWLVCTEAYSTAANRSSRSKYG